jgi:hypothetical protein
MQPSRSERESATEPLQTGGNLLNDRLILALVGLVAAMADLALAILARSPRSH